MSFNLIIHLWVKLDYVLACSFQPDSICMTAFLMRLNNFKIKIFVGVFLIVSSTVFSQQKLYGNAFNLSDVQLLPGVLKHAQEVNTHTLLQYDVDRLLAPYRKEAGLPAKAESYPNWIGLDGHVGGHYLSAMAMNYAATGDAECKKRMDYMIAELKACQDANANGYVGGVPNSAKIWPALQTADFTDIRKAWVPWYNLHKTYAGLRDAWLYGGSESARSMFLAFCDWGIEITKNLTDEQMEKMLQTEHGGMNESFADAYQLTKDEKYLHAAKRFSHKEFLNSLAKGVDNLDNKHANTQIPKIIGFERIAEASNDNTYKHAATFFWEQVALKRSIALGGNSIREFFPTAANCSKYVEEREGPESCNTYNMLKLTEGLFRFEPKAHYADFYERALFNHILSTQHPEHGGYVYFTPARPRHYRVYSTPNQGMWCCVGSGMENHTKYGEFIYTHQSDSLFVNLFVASELNWRGKGLKIKQETQFPYEGNTRLTINTNKPQRFKLMIRHPFWVSKKGFVVKCNGVKLKTISQPSSYAVIDREWRDGDKIEVSLPMQLRYEELPNVPEYIAIMYGPVLLGAKTGEETLYGLKANDHRWAHIPHGPLLPIAKAPVMVGERTKMLKKIVPVKNKPLHFKTRNLFNSKEFNDLELQPFFSIHDARYMMYWLSMNKKAYRLAADSLAQLENARLALDARTVDAIVPGEQQPEADHGVKMERTNSGLFKDAFYREISQGGQLTYLLYPKGESNLKLMIRYWGNEQGKRSFKIYIDDMLVTTESTVGKWNRNEFVNVEYPLPENVLKNKNQLVLKIVPDKDCLAGGFYYIALLR